jgi:hypothetical protein
VEENKFEEDDDAVAAAAGAKLPVRAFEENKLFPPLACPTSFPPFVVGGLSAPPAAAA